MNNILQLQYVQIVRNEEIAVIKLLSFFCIQLLALQNIPVFCMIQDQIGNLQLLSQFTGFPDR